jgi:hypothetical protein
VIIAEDFWFYVAVVAFVIAFIGLVLMLMKAINNNGV